MKISKLECVVIFLIVVAFFAVSSASAQQQPAVFRDGARVLSGAEREAAIERVKTQTMTKSSQKQPGGNSVPKFTFMFVGDFRTGLTVYARNTDIITQDIIVIALRRYPNQPAQYLSAVHFTTIDHPITEGAIWYPLEEEKKLVWGEDQGIASYELIVLQGSSTAVYRVERNFNNYDQYNRAHSFVHDGVAVYDGSGSLKIYLFGNFIGSVGAVARNENGWEWAVPRKGITNNRAMVTIDTSTIQYFEKYGDIKIAVVNGDGMSDDFTVRIKPFGSNYLADQEILKSLIRRYSR